MFQHPHFIRLGGHSSQNVSVLEVVAIVIPPAAEALLFPLFP